MIETRDLAGPSQAEGSATRRGLDAHPVADLFPMVPDDELKELAHDIAARGLLHPIVLDPEGRILDGRNRYAACELASVEPTFTTYEGDDPDGYALTVNIARRHLTKGQRAMLVASAEKFSTREAGALADVDGSYVVQARAVRRHAPDLVRSVIEGSAVLSKAYEIARERKRAAQSAESAMTLLRAEAADLADQVIEERLTLDGARKLLEERRREAELRAAVERVDEIRDAEGSPGPSFAERAEDGAVTWAEALTLAQQWEEERAASIRRAQASVGQVVAHWGAVQTIREQAGTPYADAILSGLQDTHRAALDRIFTDAQNG
ncbi:ParB/RepB/Spo0J family partition protein [Streptomyces sp. H27-H5]|uniref:ParB/RepB/Spo0J family partition protein n=1 Tax=Streptomyces sp. H27-H5 TaxID=2996460 RepID=UPI002270C5ED|nr:ParB/RepB/Spo0J family partition protein [Streptomyces sp. H27-H5]MCY0957727.1 ParB/RepB/Spo0J family partition protein [Streptomyces sp. H27-H5]